MHFDHRHASTYREVTPFDDGLIDNYIRHAHEYHDTLIEMGGRPTRKVLLEPAGKAIYVEDEIRILDDHGKVQGTVALDENLTLYHWTKERARFEDELDRWKEFLKHQKERGPGPLLTITLDLEYTDQRLMEILIKLNVWRDFQYYQQVQVGRAAMLTWETTRDMEELMHEEASCNEPHLNRKIQCGLSTCFRQLFPQQQSLETSQMQLAWIKSQVPDILTEACASLDSDGHLQRQLEMKLEQQANAWNQELKNLEARLDPPLQSPHASAGSVPRICHWGSEITRLMDEHWEWKIFLKWRTNKPYAKQLATVEDEDSSELRPGLQIWVDYVSYRRYQLARTRSWVASWQRLQEEEESELENITMDQGLLLLMNVISGIKSDVQRFQQDIHRAELQVQSAEQQLARFSSSQRFAEGSISSPRLLPSPPKTESPEIPPQDGQMKDSSSSPTTIHPPRVLARSSVTGNRGSMHSSGVLEETEIQVLCRNIHTEKPFDDADAVPGHFITDDDTPNCSYQYEALGKDKGAEPSGDLQDDVKDTLMIDVEASGHISLPTTRKVDSKARITGLSPKLPMVIHQVPKSTKIQSSIKRDQTASSRILKNTGKRPNEKAKASTKEKSLALLDAISVKGSSTDLLPLRRSQRLKEKGTASSFSLPSHAPTLPSSIERSTERTGPARKSKQKRHNIWGNPIEPSVS